MPGLIYLSAGVQMVLKQHQRPPGVLTVGGRKRCFLILSLSCEYTNKCTQKYTHMQTLFEVLNKIHQVASKLIK